MPWTSNVRIPCQQSKSSPALAAFRGQVHMVHAGDSSNDIWHTWLDNGAWTVNDRIPDQRSKAPSAIVSFQDRLHLAHLGDSSNRIWHSSWNGTRWTTNEPIPDALSQASPAMAVFQDRLHLLHIGNSSHQIHHLEFDGFEWTRRPDDDALAGQRSKGPVALAVFNNELHMVHQGDTSNRLFHARFDGTRWTEDVQITGQLSKSPPVLAALNGQLHLLHLGDSSNRIWHSATADGLAFADNIAIPYQSSKAAPGMAALVDRLHMVHLGDSSNDLWYTSSDGVLVRRPARRVVVVDLDGCRWDRFYRHLKRVRDAGASTEATYTFVLPDGASDDTILEDGGMQLQSALGELCFTRGNGMVDVRLALAAYPTFTFPSHGTMYTGNPPGQHGVTGHTFVVRDAAPEWDRHSWDSLPRGLALQGYCTDEEGEFGAFLDYIWGGFDEVGENACRNRNRGLVSDLRVVNMFERAHDAGLRTCSIHSFYHGAPRPWDAEGRDQWWRYSPHELRSVKDVCSDEDIDQLETVDHGALVKADLLLGTMPSKLVVIAPSALPGNVPDSADRMTGERRPGWQVSGEQHPDGVPDLVAIYLASIDEASHDDGIFNQETYLAWFDHRLARFVRNLRQVDPEAFENTVFAFVADHGHSQIANAPATDGVPSDNVLAVREELVRLLLGDADGQAFLDLARTISEMPFGPSYGSLVSEAIEDDLSAHAEAMNLYVYARNAQRFPPTDIARRLLARRMRTEPYGALVLVRGRYQFLAPGATSPVELTSTACRVRVRPQLDVPVEPVGFDEDEEIQATSLSPADVQAEGTLRQQLNTDAVFDRLRVAERVAGFVPDGINQSPDVVLLAPAGRSFTNATATHGSFAYPPSRIPMLFCGPGIRDHRTTIDTADLADFAPTVLTLLGLNADDLAGMQGRPLLDRWGQVAASGAPSAPEQKPAPCTRAPGSRRPWAPRPHRLPRVTAVLDAAIVRPATSEEIAEPATLPALVALSLQPARPRRSIAVGDAAYVEPRSATALVTASGGAWVEIDGRRETIRTGSRLPIAAARSIRIRSEGSYGSIDVPRALLVVPLSVELPRVPDWLRRILEMLAQTSKIVIDDRRLTAGTLLVTADELARAVELLKAQLDAADVHPADAVWRAGHQRPLTVQRPGSGVASVRRSAETLRELLDRRIVAGLRTAGRSCAG